MGEEWGGHIECTNFVVPAQLGVGPLGSHWADFFGGRCPLNCTPTASDWSCILVVSAGCSEVLGGQLWPSCDSECFLRPCGVLKRSHPVFRKGLRKPSKGLRLSEGLSTPSGHNQRTAQVVLRRGGVGMVQDGAPLCKKPSGPNPEQLHLGWQDQMWAKSMGLIIYGLFFQSVRVPGMECQWIKRPQVYCIQQNQSQGLCYNLSHILFNLHFLCNFSRHSLSFSSLTQPVAHVHAPGALCCQFKGPRFPEWLSLTADLKPRLSFTRWQFKMTFPPLLPSATGKITVFKILIWEVSMEFMG